MAKFCGICGAKLEDDMKVCGYCGTPSAPNITSVNMTDTRKPNVGKSKKILVSLTMIVAIVIGIISFSSFSNEPCDWCGNTPTKSFKTKSGNKSYVCSDCRKECTWCGDRATKHYENYFDMIVFVCKDCYEDAVE